MLIALFSAAAVSPAAEPAALSGRAMGTTWSVKWLQPETPLEPAAVERRVVARLEQLEQLFSTYRPDSDLSRFNRSDSVDWIAVPPELARVAAQARNLSALTGGAFDVTVAPLLQLWGFGPEGRPGAQPAPSEIAANQTHVGWQRLEVRLDPPALRKTEPKLAADLSSIAKGFAVDALSELLTCFGAPNHLAQIGGDLRAAGPGPEGRGWRVAIEQPIEGPTTVARVVSLTNHALSTSGNHRNFVSLGGRRLGHIIDPRTGSPAAGALASVSVIHHSGASSSALATGLFVLGPEEGYALAVREKLACLFIVRDGAALLPRATPEFATRSVPAPAGGVP